MNLNVTGNCDTGKKKLYSPLFFIVYFNVNREYILSKFTNYLSNEDYIFNKIRKLYFSCDNM